MKYPRILAQHETRRLLLASFGQARTGRQLSELAGIPIARCYRLLCKLHLLGLVEVEGVYLSANGKGKLLFGGRLPGVEIFVDGSRVRGRIRRPSISEPS
ncbi:MAG: hypothetical protein LN413_03555 [Candidatus Thermoplasmatota archaeon]|nr:hypothetical protein [Candidatus Thermoplasmatota archaeon]